MSVDKFSKHQKTTKPKFMAQHPRTKRVLFSGHTYADFLEAREKFLATNQDVANPRKGRRVNE